MDNLTIKQMRLIREMSLQQVADKLGVHFNTYSGYEKDPLSMSIGNAYKLADIYGVSVEDIFLAAKSTKC